MQAILDRPDTPTRRRFDAYCRMAEAGILSPKDRVELIDGEVIEMAPMGSLHGGTTDHLTTLIARAVADGEVQVRVQGSLRLDAFNEPQPDVLLLVEVADSSLAWDRGPKLALCARHGVPEVWIVDLQGRAVNVCRQPGPGGYAEQRSVVTGGLTPTLVPTFGIEPSALLGEQSSFEPVASAHGRGLLSDAWRR